MAARKEADDDRRDASASSERVDLADEARRMVFGDRHIDYGAPERNLTKIGMVWGALLGIEPIPPRTVAVMMTGMKMVRAAGRTNRDDLIDGVGYLLLADEASDH